MERLGSSLIEVCPSYPLSISLYDNLGSKEEKS
jgi:hypothetical protein